MTRVGPTAPGERPSEDPNRSFARFLVTDLLADEERAHQRRIARATWLVAAGLTLLALALPTERLLGRGPELVHEASDAGFALRSLVRWGLFAPAAELGARLFDTSLEAGAYLASALAYGLSVPALAALARALAAPPGASLGIALFCALSPAGWLAGTLPGATHAITLSTALLLLGLFRTPRSSQAARAGLSALALALYPLNAILIPLPWLERRAPSGKLTALALVGWYAALCVAADATPLGVAALSPKLWSIPLPYALLIGAGLLLVRELQRPPREPEESPPPRWLTLLALSVFVSSLWSFAALFTYLALLAVAASYGQARRPAARFGALGAGLLGLQVALTAATALALARTDPDRAWRERVVRVLAPTDAVATTSLRHAYLLRERWGLRTALYGTGSAELGAFDDEALADLASAPGRRFFELPPAPGEPHSTERDRLRARFEELGFAPLVEASPAGGGPPQGR